MNNICLNATITKDLDLAYAQSGTAWLSFSVAYNHNKDEASFFDVKAFGKTAEHVAQYYAKGDGINLEGELKQETWEDRGGGGKRSKTVIIVRRTTFPRGKKQGDSGERERQPQRTAPRESAQGYGDGGGADSLGIDDIPFGAAKL
jgi:single-strand DNA-binding protein